MTISVKKTRSSDCPSGKCTLAHCDSIWPNALSAVFACILPDGGGSEKALSCHCPSVPSWDCGKLMIQPLDRILHGIPVTCHQQLPQQQTQMCCCPLTFEPSDQTQQFFNSRLKVFQRPNSNHQHSNTCNALRTNQDQGHFKHFEIKKSQTTNISALYECIHINVSMLHRTRKYVLHDFNIIYSSKDITTSD